MTNPPPGAAVPQDDTQRALDELERLIKDGNVNEDAWDYYRAQDMLATLRAALVPPADDEISAIRARHEGLDAALKPWDWTQTHSQNAHTDRATLLRAVDRLSAELAKERERRGEVDGWQPIETAPKDGTRVLVWSVPIANYYNADEPPHVAIAYWLERRPNEIRMGFHSGWVWHGMAGCTFTHWRPLPTPPATQHEDTP